MSPVAAPPTVHVLVIHPRDPEAPTVGGIQTFLHDFIKYAPADFEITVAGATRDRRSRPIGRLRKISIGGHPATLLPLAPSGGMPRDPAGLLAGILAQLRLRLAMVRGGRILQLHRPYRPFFIAGHRGPRVQFIHVDMREWPGTSAWNQVRGLYRAFSTSALEAMARVFVVNEFGADMIRHDHPRIADRVEFLPVWYDPDTFFPASADERREIRSRLLKELGAGAGDGRPLVLWAGRLDPIKNPELALDGLAELERQGTQAHLVIAGSGELLPGLEERARQLGIADAVHFAGDVSRERLAELMRAADVLLLTSRAEGGGPRVVVEALASGVPAVATLVGEVRRTVVHMGNGWLVEEPTAAAVAAGISWVLQQPRDVIGAAATRAAAPFTAAQVLGRVYAAYRSLAGATAADAMATADPERP